MGTYDVSYVDDREQQIRDYQRRLAKLRQELERSPEEDLRGRVGQVLMVAENKVKIADQAVERAKGANGLAWVDAKQHLDAQVAAVDEVWQQVDAALLG